MLSEDNIRIIKSNNGKIITRCNGRKIMKAAEMYLKNRDIIFVSSDDWESGLKTSKFHLATQLSQNNRVLFVESIGLRAPSVSAGDVSRIATKFKKWLKWFKPVNDNLTIFTPIVLPFHKYGLIRKINKELLAMSVKLSAGRLNFHNPILWIFIPTAVDLVGRCNEALSLYYCVDEFAQFPGVHTETVEALERELLEKVDLCFTSAHHLWRDKSRYNPSTYYMPHGVDIAHFAKALEPDIEIASEIASLPKPVIGFYGLIEKWIDLDLIEYIAKSHPEWSMVMIGKHVVDISRFDDIKNVYFLGPKPYETLYTYSKGFDAALIPFAMNKLTLNVNPLKLREYLAAGVPVVSVDLPEVRKYAEVVKIAVDYADFVRQIEFAVQENNPYLARYRSDYMQDESWERKMESISEVIGEIGS